MKEEFPDWFGIRRLTIRQLSCKTMTQVLAQPVSYSLWLVDHHRNLQYSVYLRSQRCEMSADVARGHDSDGGGDDRPPTHHIPTGCGGCFTNRGKGTRKPNLGRRKAGRLHTHQETRNLWLKKTTDDKAGRLPLGDLKSVPGPSPQPSRAESTIEPSPQPSRQRAEVVNDKTLSGRATGGCPPPPQSTVDPADVKNLKKSNKSLTKQVKMTMRLFSSDNKFSQMLDQFESSSEFGGPSGGGGCGDDEPGGDEDGDEDEEDEEDGNS
ncbi:hypothetical protein Tco_0642319 [Tanacetum coccineum]